MVFSSVPVCFTYTRYRGKRPEIIFIHVTLGGIVVPMFQICFKEELVFSRDAPQDVPEHGKSQSVCSSVCCWKCVCVEGWHAASPALLNECGVTAYFWREITSSVPLAELAEWTVLAASAWSHWTWKALLKFQVVCRHALWLDISLSHLWLKLEFFSKTEM